MNLGTFPSIASNVIEFFRSKYLHMQVDPHIMWRQKDFLANVLSALPRIFDCEQGAVFKAFS